MDHYNTLRRISAVIDEALSRENLSPHEACNKLQEIRKIALDSILSDMESLVMPMEDFNKAATMLMRQLEIQGVSIR